MRLKRVLYSNSFYEERYYGIMGQIGTAMKFRLKKGWDRFKYGLILRPDKYYRKWGSEWQQRHPWLSAIGHGVARTAASLGAGYLWNNYATAGMKSAVGGLFRRANNAGLGLMNKAFNTEPGRWAADKLRRGFNAVRHTNLGHKVLKTTAEGFVNIGKHLKPASDALQPFKPRFN